MSLLAGTTIYPTKILQKIIFTKIIPYVKFAQNLQRRKRVLHEKSYLGKTADSCQLGVKNGNFHEIKSGTFTIWILFQISLDLSN